MATHSILQSRFPVEIPQFPELLVSDGEFVKYLEKINENLASSIKTTVSHDTSTLDSTIVRPNQSTESSPFIKALHASSTRVHDAKSMVALNLVLTENRDLAHSSSEDALVDLFYKLTEDVVGKNHLEAAWKCDSLATLKIIFNARSIHLGKSNRVAAYKAMGWLYQNHPMTFLVNLPWIARPVILKPKPKPKKQERDDEKKSERNVETETKDEDSDDDFVVVVPPEGASFDSMAMDRIHGLAHGYWKDLLNMLALAAHDHLSPESAPKKILNIHANGMGRRTFRERGRSSGVSSKPEKLVRIWDQKEAKAIRQSKLKQQHATVIKKLETDTLYRVFHVAVARLFAAQLKRDLTLLNSSDKKDVTKISLASKWAPSLKEFHDKNTWIATSIAEIMFTHDDVCPANTPRSDRETYLKHARLQYQSKVLSPLRKALDLVERSISAKNFAEIEYQKLPSLAMQRYTSLFLENDSEHFNQYLDRVASGNATISGAVLLPSVMVSKVLDGDRRGRASTTALAERRVADLQWKTLVQRIKDSGKIESSIAVCDVSGSMGSPVRSDGTTPMHAAIGLSLLLAEVCEPPFGGSMVSFSEEPSVFQVGGPDDSRSFTEKVNHIMGSDWGMTTDFEAVFSKLILPIAVESKLKQEEMVKQVFVFSDMQFNQAQHDSARWTTSYERIKNQYEKAGYEMPTMIFWNLAAGDKGVPVKSNEKGTALVSGYSQGQMKVFLDGGGYGEDTDALVEDEVVINKSGNEVKVKKDKKQQDAVDPVQVMKKAISHQGYAMLRVVD